jgi:hypothetical protein
MVRNALAFSRYFFDKQLLNYLFLSVCHLARKLALMP